MQIKGHDKFINYYDKVCIGKCFDEAEATLKSGFAYLKAVSITNNVIHMHVENMPVNEQDKSLLNQLPSSLVTLPSIDNTPNDLKLILHGY